MSDIKVPADAKKDEWDQNAGGSFDSSWYPVHLSGERGISCLLAFFLCGIERMFLKEKVQAVFSL